MDNNSRDQTSADGAADTKPVLRELLSKMSVPNSSELGEALNCMICHETFLAGSSPEMPMKLPCNHILGSQCLLKWLSPSSTNRNNSCPLCRVAILGDQPAASHPTSEATTDEEIEQPTEFPSEVRNPFDRRLYNHIYNSLSPGLQPLGTLPPGQNASRGLLNDADEEKFQKFVNLIWGDRSNPEHPLHQF